MPDRSICRYKPRHRGSGRVRQREVVRRDPLPHRDPVGQRGPGKWSPAPIAARRTCGETVRHDRRAPEPALTDEARPWAGSSSRCRGQHAELGGGVGCPGRLRQRSRLAERARRDRRDAPRIVRDQAARLAPSARRAKHAAMQGMTGGETSARITGPSHQACPRCGLTIAPRDRGWLPDTALVASNAVERSSRCSAHGLPPACPCPTGASRSSSRSATSRELDGSRLPSARARRRRITERWRDCGRQASRRGRRRPRVRGPPASRCSGS